MLPVKVRELKCIKKIPNQLLFPFHSLIKKLFQLLFVDSIRTESGDEIYIEVALLLVISPSSPTIYVLMNKESPKSVEHKYA